MKHIFIVNLLAGNKKAKNIIPLIENLFIKSSDEYIIEYTNGEKDAEKIAYKYISCIDVRIYAVGGDGTFNEIVNSLINTQIPVGIIPSGTGDDFVKSIAGYENFKIEDIIFGIAEKIDAVKLNNRYFINISSIGIDSEVNYTACMMKKFPVPKKLRYTFAIIREILRYKPIDITIYFQEKKIVKKVTMFTFCNGKYYGGGIYINPKSVLNDGFLEFYDVDSMGLFKILKIIPKLLKGEHMDSEYVNMYRGKKILIESEKEMKLNIDGEIDKSKKLDISVIHEGINFIFPKRRDIK